MYDMTKIYNNRIKKIYSNPGDTILYMIMIQDYIDLIYYLKKINNFEILN